jgi:hypothetical protein
VAQEDEPHDGHEIFVRREPRIGAQVVNVYKAVSLQIREIFAERTPIIEPLSLDEAYLDVTENVKGIASATQIAETIRAKIRRETSLTASAGATTNSWRSLPRITASPMASLSLPRKWGRPSWRNCRLPSSMALDRRRQRK